MDNVQIINANKVVNFKLSENRIRKKWKDLRK